MFSVVIMVKVFEILFWTAVDRPKSFFSSPVRTSPLNTEYVLYYVTETMKRPGVESTNGNPDIKETFAWGQDLLRGSIPTWYHGPNLVPDDFDQKQEVFDSYC